MNPAKKEFGRVRPGEWVDLDYVAIRNLEKHLAEIEAGYRGDRQAEREAIVPGPDMIQALLEMKP